VAHAYGIEPPSTSPFQELLRSQVLDAYGNVTDTNDHARVGTDAPIHQTATWNISSGDPTMWQWRPSAEHRDAFSEPSGVPADLPADVSYVYYPDGQVETASVTA